MAIHNLSDPFQAAGCQMDERNVTITGITGSFCAPKCGTTGACPTDTCDGTVASPQCILQDQSGDKYCALVCDPTKKAPFSCSSDEHLNCQKSGSAEIKGICTYYS